MPFTANPEDEIASSFTPNPEDEIVGAFTPNPEDSIVPQETKTEPGGLFTQIKIGLQQAIPQLSQNLYNTLAGVAEAGKEMLWANVQALPIPKGIKEPTAEAIQYSPKLLRSLADVGGGMVQELEEVGERTMGPDLARKITAQGGSIAPPLALSPLGFSAMVAAAGGQSFGSTYREAREAYSKTMPEPEAEAKAIQSGLLSGLTTAIVTAGFGKTGLEAVKQIGQSVGLKAAFANVMKQAGMEATEEMVDQTLQELQSFLTFNPEKTITEAVDNVVLAGAAGGILSTAVVAPVEAASAVANKIGPATEQTVTTDTPTLTLPKTSPETSQALGIIPESSASIAGVVNKVVEFFNKSDMQDNPQIKEAIKKQDVLAGREWINSPEFLFRRDPQAGPLVTRLVEAQMDYTAKAGNDDSKFADLAKELEFDELKLVTQKMREVQEGNTKALDELPDKLKNFAGELRSYFDQWRITVQENKKSAIVKALPEAQSKVLQEILAGKDKDAAFKESKLKAAGKASVEEALAEIDEVSNWGVENYITNAEQGSWRIVDQDGTTVAIAETKTDARVKAEKFLKDNPDTTELTLTDEFDPGGTWPTQLTAPAYFRLVNEASKTLDVTAKEMQDILRESAPLITVKPTSKYNRFLQQRRNILKGEENIMDILPSYIYSMHKKQALDPILKDSMTIVPELAPNTRTAVDNLIQDVKGRKHLGDRIVDGLLQPLGMKPFQYSGFVNAARNIAAHLKLGWRPVSVFVNRMGGLHHTWTKTGFVDLMEGKKWVKSSEGQQILKANERLIGLESNLATESGVIKEEPWYKPLGLFQMMEHFNRPEAFGAFYIQATKRMGLQGEEAIKYARQATRTTQFVYNTASLPTSMRGPTGRLIFQFKPYLLKELEFLSTLSPAEWGRYLTGFLALGGPRAAIIVLRSLPVLGVAGYLAGIEDWLNRELPEASRGIPGMVAGIDISPATAPQLPQRPEEFAGPVLGDLLKLANEVIIPAIKGEQRDWNDVREWAVKLAPSLYYLESATQAMMDENGWIRDSRGRYKFQPDKWDKLKLAVGAKPLKQSIEEVETRYLNETENIARKNRSRYLDDLVDAIQKDDAAEIDRLVGMAEDYGYVTGKDLLNSIKSNLRQVELKPLERTFRSMMRSRQMEEIERLESKENP